jgi:hypothetical protein
MSRPRSQEPVVCVCVCVCICVCVVCDDDEGGGGGGGGGEKGGLTGVWRGVWYVRENGVLDDCPDTHMYISYTYMDTSHAVDGWSFLSSSYLLLLAAAAAAGAGA